MWRDVVLQLLVGSGATEHPERSRTRHRSKLFRPWNSFPRFGTTGPDPGAYINSLQSPYLRFGTGFRSVHRWQRASLFHGENPWSSFPPADSHVLGVERTKPFWPWFFSSPSMELRRSPRPALLNASCGYCGDHPSDEGRKTPTNRAGVGPVFVLKGQAAGETQGFGHDEDGDVENGSVDHQMNWHQRTTTSATRTFSVTF